LHLAAWVAQSNLSKKIFGIESKSKILCIGDSYTYGLGVKRCDAYPAQLQTKLEEKFGNGAIEVINSGMPGINTPILAGSFSEILDNYSPDVVLIMIGTNDEWNFEGFFSDPKSIKDRLFAVISSLRLSRMIKILASSFNTTQDSNTFVAQIEKKRLREILRLIEENGGLNNAYYYQALMLGNEFRDKNMFDQAKLYYDCALKINPDDVGIKKELLRYHKKALTVLSYKLKKEKIAETLSLIENNSLLNNSYYTQSIKLGNECRDLNRFDEAKLYYDFALRINPDGELVSEELLRYYTQVLKDSKSALQGELFDNSREKFRAYIRTVFFNKEKLGDDEEFGNEMIALSKVCRLVNVFEDNLLLFAKTIHLYGFNAKVWEELDELFIAWNSPEHAIRFYNYLANKFPKNVDINLRLARQYKRVLDYDQVRKYYDLVLKLDFANQEADQYMESWGLSENNVLSKKFSISDAENELYVLIDNVFENKRGYLKGISNKKNKAQEKESIEMLNYACYFGDDQPEGKNNKRNREDVSPSIENPNIALAIYIKEQRYNEKVERILKEDKNYARLFNDMGSDGQAFALRRSEKINAIALNCLKQICHIAKTRKVKLFFLSYPLTTYERVKQTAKDKEVTFIDLNQAFKSRITPDNFSVHFLPDGHCTRIGYEIIADRVGEILAGEL